MDEINFFPQGDRAITITFGNEIQKDVHQKVFAKKNKENTS
jgi:inhibitor of KinA